MRRSRWILILALVALVGVTSWLWWVMPRKVDMAAYTPADALLYLEANQPLEVVQAITYTDAWKAFAGIIGTPNATGSGWLQAFVRQTGIGPIQSVILSRAQIAAFVTDLGTTEESDTLKIRPEGALLIETHTSEGRIKAPFEEALKALAEKTYGQPTLRRISVDGIDLIEWSAPGGSRQIVGTIVGSLVIIGNSQKTVQNCVAVSRGQRKSLKDDPELGRMRLQVGNDATLTFGFVPPGNSARLLAVGLPLLLGRTPGDSEFQRLVTTGAANIFASLGWTSKTYLSGIEDRYLINLQPPVVARLKPNFGLPNITSQMPRLLPGEVYSVTSYKFANPVATWQSLKTTVSSQVDTLSTIVFSSLLKASLLSYGLDDPESFLAAVNGELLTLRLDESAERSILIGSVQDRTAFQELVTKKMGWRQVGQGETFEHPEGEFAASLTGNLIVVGSSDEVRRYLDLRQANAELDAAKLKRMTFFEPSSPSANVLTYTDDSNRVRSFIAALITAQAAPPLQAERIEEVVAGLPFSVTETTLGDAGIERTTRSPLGQFSTLLPFLIPAQPSSTTPGARSK